jgi:hypothetical protein
VVLLLVLLLACCTSQPVALLTIAAAAAATAAAAAATVLVGPGRQQLCVSTKRHQYQLRVCPVELLPGKALLLVCHVHCASLRVLL